MRSTSEQLVERWGHFYGSEAEYFSSLDILSSFDFSVQRILSQPTEKDPIEALVEGFNRGVHMHISEEVDDAGGGGCKHCLRPVGIFVPPLLFANFCDNIKYDLDGHAIAFSETHFVLGNEFICWEQVKTLVFLTSNGVVFDFNLFRDKEYFFLPGGYAWGKPEGEIEVALVDGFNHPNRVMRGGDVMEVAVYAGNNCGLMMGKTLTEYRKYHPTSGVEKHLKFVIENKKREQVLALEKKNSMAKFSVGIPVDFDYSIFDQSNVCRAVYGVVNSDERYYSEPSEPVVDTIVSVAVDDTDCCTGPIRGVSGLWRMDPLEFISNIPRMVAFSTVSEHWYPQVDDGSEDLMDVLIQTFDDVCEDHGMQFSYMARLPVDTFGLAMKDAPQWDIDRYAKIGELYILYLCSKICAYNGHDRRYAKSTAECAKDNVNGYFRWLFRDKGWFRVATSETIFGYICVHYGEDVAMMVLRLVSPDIQRLCNSWGIATTTRVRGYIEYFIRDNSEFDSLLIDIGVIVSVIFQEMNYDTRIRKRIKECFGRIGWYMMYWQGDLTCVLYQMELLDNNKVCDLCTDFVVSVEGMD